MNKDKKTKLIRITTVPVSLGVLLKGQMKYMTENGFDVLAVASYTKELDEIAKNEGVRVESIEMTRIISPFRDLKALWQLYKLFRREKPDMVHTHSPKAGTLGMIAAWLTRVPLRLHTIAGLPLMEATGIKRWILDMVEKVTYACATKVYPNSYAMQDIVIEYKFAKPEKLKVIGNGSSNGIDTSEFDPQLISAETRTSLRYELGIKEDDFVYLFVGRVVTDKGVNELVSAFANIYNKAIDTKPHLIIVGRHERELDPLLPETEKIMESNPNIHILGFHSDVRPFFASADLFVFPSYREGFPNSVMQTTAMQLNAVVSDINGCNEIISNGENGWIVPPKNIVQLQERMEWAFNNKEESKKMGMKGRAIMQKKYERTFMWEEILKEYKELLSSI